MSPYMPVEIEKMEGRIRVKWADGHDSFYPNPYLRESCNCASCVHEWTGEKVIRPEMIPPDIRPTAISAVGNYAIHIDWSDGHTTGIYPFDYLRKICPCPLCSGG